MMEAAKGPAVPPAGLAAAAQLRADKKENKFFLIYIRKFIMEQLQSHIRLRASSYMVKYLRISSHIRNPSSYTV
jgi:hypothetical protein